LGVSPAITIAAVHHVDVVVVVDGVGCIEEAKRTVDALLHHFKRLVAVGKKRLDLLARALEAARRLLRLRHRGDKLAHLRQTDADVLLDVAKQLIVATAHFIGSD